MTGTTGTDRFPEGPEQTVLRWLHRGGFAVTMFAVALQMGRVNGGFLTNYFADLAGPAWMYGAIRQRATVLRYLYRPIPSPALTAIFVFLVGTGWEICQAFDFSGTILNVTRGRFDPLDILAYAASLTVCFAADVCARRRTYKQLAFTEKEQLLRENS